MNNDKFGNKLREIAETSDALGISRSSYPGPVNYVEEVKKPTQPLTDDQLWGEEQK